ncbi:MAG: hypothetical protein OHK0052_20620 [Anaerolineales bacterium]
MKLDYTPIDEPDPEFMLVLQNGAEANAFHRAVLNHIQARQTPMRLPSNGYVGCNHITPEQWYANVMQTVRDLVAPLYAINPSPLEAAFVLRWALLAAAEGRR